MQAGGSGRSRVGARLPRVMLSVSPSEAAANGGVVCLTLMTMRLTWDPAKAASNLRKHGVSFEEALTVYGDLLARIHDDPHHSEREHREMIAGHSTKGRHWSPSQSALESSA